MHSAKSIACSAVSVGYGNGVGIRRAAGTDRDETAGVHDAIERRTIHHKVLDDRKCQRPQGLDSNFITVGEVSHVELANGDAFFFAMGDTVDDKTARTADAFSTVMIEGDGFFAPEDQVLVEDVEHLQKRHVGADVFELVGLESAFVSRIFLPPHVQGQPHL